MEKLLIRKTAKKLLLIQWSRFQNVLIKLEGSTLFTGVNGTGKTTILDAVTYLLTGNSQFNIAAKDRDRTVLGYVRGDTKSNGESRYLRAGEVISYVVMEFYDPATRSPFVVGVCIESPNEAARPNGSWFICQDTSIDQMNFAVKEGKMLKVTPKNELQVRGVRMRASSFLGRDKGTEQVLRALGLRCGVAKYKSKLLKMMAFNPENNIDQFIQGSVLEPGKVESLKDLREQKRQFEHLKEMYEGFSKGKNQLEEIEKRSTEYENKKRQLQIRELMVIYQELKAKQGKKEEIDRNKKLFEDQLEDLQKRQKRLAEEQEKAQERLRIAENNDTIRGMKDTLAALERQIEDLGREETELEEKLAQVLKLEMALRELADMLNDVLPLEKDEYKRLTHLAGKEYNLRSKIEIFRRYSEKVSCQEKIYATEEVHLSDSMEKLEAEIAELCERIKRLKSNIMVYPPDVERARTMIADGLRRQGINTEVHIFAELVQEVTDPAWRRAIETFLGRKRFFIIVDGKYCRKAMEVLRNQKIYSGNVVITDKLPETEITKGSAAQILKIPNIYARRYANYLLNGIHLCETLEELHEYPKGGLMKNGMLAKSYAASMMNMSKMELCLGEDAIRIQLEQAEKNKAEKENILKAECEEKAEIEKRRGAIDKIDWHAERYEFGAKDLLDSCVDKKKKLQNEKNKIQDDPSFAMLFAEQEAAGKYLHEVNDAVSHNDQMLGECKNELKKCRDNLGKIAAEIFSKEREYERETMQHLELKAPMLAEYEKLREKKPDSWIVLTSKTVDNLRGELKECEKKLENSQWEYCKLMETDINKRGVGYIAHYRNEYRNLARVKIEETKQKLEEQSKKLESAFMNDFVAEINESVREAKREMDAINRELRQIPFGNDTYRFVMNEKSDRSTFFRICRRLENHMDSLENYMNSNRDDEEMEQDIQEFMDRILREEDELEYTDYRRYFSYDMEIVSRQGHEEITANLSNKQGSASNGEKQTPYFIILAASLRQCYPENTCCARLAFIDEAFSALSRERIEQMVKYFEENHFQVFYAAPPEKIGSIGSFIHSTVSLVNTGRYTNAVEGLVKTDEIFV